MSKIDKNLKVDAAHSVVNEMLLRSHIFKRIEKNKHSLEKLLEYKEPSMDNLKDSSYFLVLRRWNSFTPSMVVHDSLSKGGGYFLKWYGTGIVIDPGFNFVENFHSQGLRIQDIDCIFVTHAHIDHCVELEAILTLLFEYNEKHKDKKNEKKISLYLNLSTYKKYGDWFTSCSNKLIEKIHIIESGITINIPNNKNTYSIVVNPTKAKHNEIWDDKYSVGLIFTLRRVDGVVHSIGLTSDTGWSTEIMEQYRRCELLILHLGGIKEKEIYGLGSIIGKDRLYDNHLGVLGITLMLQNLMKFGKSNGEKMAVISEFGEELKGISKELLELIWNKVEKSMYGEEKKLGDPLRLNCIIGDVGTKISFEGKQPYSRCESKGCGRKAEKEDIVLKGGVIAHYCKKHTPVKPREELAGIIGRIAPKKLS